MGSNGHTEERTKDWEGGKPGERRERGGGGGGRGGKRPLTNRQTRRNSGATSRLCLQLIYGQSLVLGHDSATEFLGRGGGGVG